MKSAHADATSEGIVEYEQQVDDQQCANFTAENIDKEWVNDYSRVSRSDFVCVSKTT